MAEKHKKELLGQGKLQKAQVRQWIDFASFEIYQCSQSIVYPIFGWKPYCKEEADKANARIKDLLKYLDQQVKDKKFVLGDILTLADVSLFNKLKFFFQLVFPKGLRKKVFPNVNKWFEALAETTEVKRVYGKIHLCNVPVKPFIGKKKEEKKEEKKEKKPEEKKEEKKKKKNQKVQKDSLKLMEKMEL